MTNTPRPAPPGWAHEPGRKGNRDLHNPDRPPCFGCWCYGCGAATNGPRIEHEVNEQHPGDPDHRWCFE